MRDAAERWDVLLIDDEPVVLDAVRRVLEEEGMSVAVATDAESGLAHGAGATCRLVLCDLMLPDGSGIDVVRELRRRRGDLPLIVITGYATSESAVDAGEAGAAGFLPKPFTDGELLDVVRRALAGSESGKGEEEA